MRSTNAKGFPAKGSVHDKEIINYSLTIVKIICIMKCKGETDFKQTNLADTILIKSSS